MRASSLLIATLFTTHVFAGDFTLQTDAFKVAQTIPKDYTCDGNNLSPQLNWAQPPAKTKSFTLIMSDPDAPSGTYYHWIVYNIPYSTLSFAKGINKYPEGSILGKNSEGTLEYKGPCPPPGKAHHYVFTLYALDTVLTLPEGTNAEKLLPILNNHLIEKVEITGSYGR